MHVRYSELVKELRSALGLSQEGLARRMNVSFSTVSNWENGRTKPLPALAHLLVEMAQEAGIAAERYSEPRRRTRGAK